jgi:pantoate--beta-alanine ligase
MSYRCVGTVAELRERLAVVRAAGRRIGFVPTMGALHEGHLSLMRLAGQSTDHVVVSIFVNPTQFGPDEDLASYPRTLARDEQLCRSVGVETVFAPAASSMYAADASVRVVERSLSTGLCGASRPGHFDGVATVVCKLFNIVQPDVAVFGQKDAQQLALIRRMVRDLDMPVEIVAAPIVRESDGLAMSSRNSYLTQDERERALCLSRGLRGVERYFSAGGNDVAVTRDMLIAEVSAVGGELDYVACVDAETLDVVPSLRSGTLVALAVRIGTTRLIDNVVLG